MLTTLQKHILPSRRIGKDPLLPIPDSQRFAPITISRLRVITPVKKCIIAVRQPVGFTLSDDRRLTIVIPFRNRETHLAKLLPPLRNILVKNKINYRILVVEQTEGKLFNRGKLLNVGTHYTWSESDYFCFHDVDMIPSFAEYRCPSQPLRLVAILNYSHRDIDKFEGSYFGGNITLTKKHLSTINGLSNRYWGWGKEDDDLLFRCLLKGLVPFEDRQGTFADLDTPIAEKLVNQKVIKKGSNQKLKSQVFRLLRDPHADGLAEVKYDLLNEEKNKDIWHIRVDI